MPTLLDIQEEVKTLFHDMQNRVGDLDTEQKRLREDLTSKTGVMPAEYKTSIDALNAEINKQMDAIEKLKAAMEQERIASQRPPLDGKSSKKRRSETHDAFMKCVKLQGRLELMTPQERSLIVYSEMQPEQKALYAGDATTGKHNCPSMVA